MKNAISGPFDHQDRPYLSEAEAWHEIARRIEAGEWNRKGLCEEVKDLYCAGDITGETECDMLDRIEGALNGYSLWLAPRGQAQPRIEIARRFSEEAQYPLAAVSA